jgi:PTH1 family peptidyl-tRNA hydrolase
MLLWVGLGNPEPGMARNRHNIGFMAVQAIASRHGFAPWRVRFKGMATEGRIGEQKVLLLRPMTYMNLSGESVQEAASFFKIVPADITVFHDELDIAPGNVRAKKGGGNAGHNGLRSIDQRLGTPDYWRVRLGIGHPGDKARVTGHVLSDFSKAETWLAPLLDEVAANADLLAAGKLDEFCARVKQA